MNHRVVSAFMALCLVSVLAVASVVSADEHAILSGDSYSVEASLSLAETLEYSWTCDVFLDFVVEDPTGGVYTYVTDEDSWSAFIIAFVSGTYTLTWYNNATTVAHLNFDLSNSGSVEEGMSTLVWGAVIGVIVIIAVIVVVVIVVVMGGRNAPPQPAMGPQPQMTAQAVATGHCPTCGNQIDPNASFCAKCGTRYR